MADIPITGFNPIYDPPAYDLYSAPAAANLSLANAAYLDASGLLAQADANLEWPLRVEGLITVATLQYYTANAFRGRAYLDDTAVSGLSLGDFLWLSTTAGALADAPPGVDELQTLTITGTPTGGTFTLTFMGQTTTTIAYNATSATVQAALEALTTIGIGDIVCAGGALPGTPVTIQFQGALGRKNVPAITGTFTGLTGGSTPDGSIAETTPGVNDILVARVIPLWDGTTVRKIIEILGSGG